MTLITWRFCGNVHECRYINSHVILCKHQWQMSIKICYYHYLQHFIFCILWPIIRNYLKFACLYIFFTFINNNENWKSTNWPRVRGEKWVLGNVPVSLLLKFSTFLDYFRHTQSKVWILCQAPLVLGQRGVSIFVSPGLIVYANCCN